MYRIVSLLCLAGMVAVPPAADVLGTHPPNSSAAVFDGMNVTAVARITPWDITAGETTDANLQIRLFDTATLESISNVTYRIDIYRNDDLLARGLFYDADGTLDVEVRPDSVCHSQKLWQCTWYLGATHPISGGLHAAGGERPVIEGPIFDRGGLYDIRVRIEGTHDPANLLAEPLIFEARVAVSQEYDFLIRAEQAHVPVVVKTYYDEITSFGYSDRDDAIRLEMPFDWSPDHVSQVQVVHQEIRIPDSFEPYAYPRVADLKGYVNGVEVGDRVLLLDPYSYDGTNIVHFLVTGYELERISSLLGPSDHDSGTMVFELVPGGVARNPAQFHLADPDTGDATGSTVSLSWDDRYGAGDEIPFVFAFLDGFGDLMEDARYAYRVLDGRGEIVASGGHEPGVPGIEAARGIDVRGIVIPATETHRIDVMLLGRGPDPSPAYAGAGSVLIEVGPASGMADTGRDPLPRQDAAAVPSWVRSNAKLWSDGRIDDQTFVHGLQWLVANGVIAAGSLAPEHLLQEATSDEISPYSCEMQVMSPEHDLRVQPLPVWDARGEKMQVMSPEYDLGCVDMFTARFLENSGWYVLDEYPEDFASEHWFENAGNLADFKSRNRLPDYQFDGDSYARDPDTGYVWIQIPYPDCWMPPWDQNGQHVQGYYADRGIEVHDTEWLPHHYPAMCDACECLGGYIMFLTPEHDRADVLGIDFGVESPP